MRNIKTKVPLFIVVPNFKVKLVQKIIFASLILKNLN